MQITELSHSCNSTNLYLKGYDYYFQYDGRTHRGQSKHSCGGVARNVADALIKLGLENTRLISVVGNDENGKIILKSLGAAADTVERLPDINTAR